ncbi:unnamed protein product [Cuscuta epithymum]|nr:unnamed protein product [Cuscuta epithymum]
MVAARTVALGRKEEAVYTVTSYKGKHNKSAGVSAAAGEDSLKSAWRKACQSGGPATLAVTDGLFSEGAVIIDGSGCNNKGVITFEMKGTTHLAPENANFGEAWIKFYKVSNVLIDGGVLNAQGGSGRATTLAIHNSAGVTIRGVTLQNSQMFHMAIVDCSNVVVTSTEIQAPEDSQNTDGIHVSRSSQVKITGSNVIGTGDDCISIGPGCTNLLVDGLDCGPGHGVSIGSLGKESGEEPVKDITVQNVHFHGTTNGVRIKTFANNNRGLVEGVLFQQLTMEDVENPVIIDQQYESSSSTEDSNVQIQDVKYEDIRGTSASQEAVVFKCSATHKCTGITVSDVALTYNGNKPDAICNNVRLVNNAPCNNVLL